MGSCPRGTKCAYCGVREAGYIPDGAAGPVCFEPQGECCWDRAQDLGWEIIVQERLLRLWNKKLAGLSKDGAAHLTLKIAEVEQKVFDFIWRG